MELTPRASKRALAQARSRVKKGKFAGRFLPEMRGKNPQNTSGSLPTNHSVRKPTPTDLTNDPVPVSAAWEAYKKRRLEGLVREEQAFKADYEMKTRLVAYQNYLPKTNEGLNEAELTILEISGETDLSRDHRKFLDEALIEANDTPEFAARLRRVMFNPEAGTRREDVGMPGSYTGETIIMLHMLYKASKEDTRWKPLFDAACAAAEYNNDRKVEIVDGERVISYPSGGKYGDVKEYAEKHGIAWPGFPSENDTRSPSEKKADEALTIGYWGSGYDES